ncbi:hypothetical protein CC86DRAFT_365675 [Ophiobolus disseminans]|uniref:Uncharacterized protein n=1 Tax=Ophiobolus disseminans TaxID=1469910 RepID=A0A6A7AN49_9PLEO|nr:hypothetical protein CC86DRAFT_365675 [Ophiobolus disseminans]
MSTLGFMMQPRNTESSGDKMMAKSRPLPIVETSNRKRTHSPQQSHRRTKPSPYNSDVAHQHQQGRTQGDRFRATNNIPPFTRENVSARSSRPASHIPLYQSRRSVPQTNIDLRDRLYADEPTPPVIQNKHLIPEDPTTTQDAMAIPETQSQIPPHSPPPRHLEVLKIDKRPSSHLHTSVSSPEFCHSARLSIMPWSKGWIDIRRWSPDRFIPDSPQQILRALSPSTSAFRDPQYGQRTSHPISARVGPRYGSASSSDAPSKTLPANTPSCSKLYQTQLVPRPPAPYRLPDRLKWLDESDESMSATLVGGNTYSSDPNSIGKYSVSSAKSLNSQLIGGLQGAQHIGDDEGQKTMDASRNYRSTSLYEGSFTVPKFERTYTDIAADNFYGPSAVTQSIQQTKPAQSSLMSSNRSDEHLQRAFTQAARFENGGGFRIGAGDKRRSWLGFPGTAGVGGRQQEWDDDIGPNVNPPAKMSRIENPAMMAAQMRRDSSNIGMNGERSAFTDSNPYQFKDDREEIILAFSNTEKPTQGQTLKGRDTHDLTIPITLQKRQLKFTISYDDTGNEVSRRKLRFIALGCDSSHSGHRTSIRF